MKNHKLAYACLTSLFLLLVAAGCASKNPQTMTGNTDYKKLLQLQKQKVSATKEAEEPLEAGLKATAESHEYGGDNYLRQGNFVSAFSEYQKALEMEPGRTMMRYKMGMLFLNRNLPDDAMKEFEQILVKEPNNGYAYYGRARVNFAKDNLKKAKEDLQRAGQLKADMWQAYTLLGIIYDREKQHAEAEKMYEKALAIQPKSAMIYNDLGVSRYMMGRYRDAADAFLKAFVTDPENQRICNNLGLTLFRLERTDDAMEAFRRGGDEAMALNNVGYLAMKDRKYNQAIAALEKAIEAKPSYYRRARVNLERAKLVMKESKKGNEGAILRPENESSL